MTTTERFLVQNDTLVPDYPDLITTPDGQSITWKQLSNKISELPDTYDGARTAWKMAGVGNVVTALCATECIPEEGCTAVNVMARDRPNYTNPSKDEMAVRYTVVQKDGSFRSFSSLVGASNPSALPGWLLVTLGKQARAERNRGNTSFDTGGAYNPADQDSLVRCAFLGSWILPVLLAQRNAA
ncbi:MAG: hypothetical protein ABI220_05065 [Candidatus Saccharimonadales bacterium]